ncbi:MAG: L-2-hydroxyglutarate oxidase [Rhodothermales bacterium]
MTYDVAIIGAGIVGLATARNISDRYPELSLIVLEKEKEIARHQTGRNSGVIHSGIYYRPGSLKARNCREGRKALIEFCEAENVAFDMCGKVIVAVEEDELPLLRDIHERGRQNGIRCELIGRNRLLELEPHAAGLQAIYVPDAGIVDFPGVARRLSEIITARGHRLLTEAGVQGMHSDSGDVVLETMQGDVRARHVVSCAGLHADRVARMSGQNPDMKIVPFRGEYYELRSEARYLCRNLIYPVPDPAFPFLGVHFTRMIDGRIECGPNAVLAFAREGYRFGTVNPAELAETLAYRGFRRLARRHWRKGAFEMWRSLSKRAFLKTLQRLIPEVKIDDLNGSRAGVRAQAVLPNGDLADDFVIKESGRVLNVCNAPSPAATASLKIGEEIVDRLASHFTTA